MPFHIRKFKTGWRVYDDKGKSFSKKPLSKTRATAQLRALYANIPEERTFRGSGYCVMDKDMYLDGEGFFSDFFDKVKKTTSQIVQRVKDVSKGIRLGYSPKSRAILDGYGDFTITQIYVRRKPIEKILDKVLDAITVGQFSEAKAKYSYDSMFHLSMVFALSPPKGQGTAFVMVEKNQVINMEELTYRQVISVPHISFRPPSGLKFREVMNRAQDAAGRNFWLYDAFSNNCQMFIAGILRANGLLTPNLQSFIVQNVEGMLTQLPSYIKPVARGITDIAALADVALQGGTNTIIKMPVKKFIAEHKKLVKLLNESASKLGAEGAEQSAELKKMTGGAFYESDRDSVIQQLLNNVDEWDDIIRILEGVLRKFSDNADARARIRRRIRQVQQEADNTMSLSMPWLYAQQFPSFIRELPITPGLRPIITPPSERVGSGKRRISMYQSSPALSIFKDVYQRAIQMDLTGTEIIYEIVHATMGDDELMHEIEEEFNRRGADLPQMGNLVTLNDLITANEFDSPDSGEETESESEGSGLRGGMDGLRLAPCEGEAHTGECTLTASQIAELRETLEADDVERKDLVKVIKTLEPTLSNELDMNLLNDAKNDIAGRTDRRSLQTAINKVITILDRVFPSTTGGKKVRWVQKVVSKMKTGAFTKQALKHKMTPEQFAKEVLANPSKYTITTRRRAQFLENMSKRPLRGGVMYEDDYAQLVYELSRINQWNDLRDIIRRIGDMFRGSNLMPVIEQHIMDIMDYPTPQQAAVALTQLVAQLPRTTGERHPEPRSRTPDPGELGYRPTTPSTASVGTNPSRPSSAESQRTVLATPPTMSPPTTPPPAPKRRRGGAKKKV